MKTLLLLRHAKSSWDDPSLADMERPLAPRGVGAAARMGRELADRGWLPQRALVSPAVRTRATWELVAGELRLGAETTFNARLYEADARQLLLEIRRTPERIGSLLVVGHNPGLEDLARSLRGDGSDATAQKMVAEKFPTAALARLRIRRRLGNVALWRREAEPLPAPKGSFVRCRQRPVSIRPPSPRPCCRGTPRRHRAPARRRRSAH